MFSLTIFPENRQKYLFEPPDITEFSTLEDKQESICKVFYSLVAEIEEIFYMMKTFHQ